LLGNLKQKEEEENNENPGKQRRGKISLSLKRAKERIKMEEEEEQEEEHAQKTIIVLDEEKQNESESVQQIPQEDTYFGFSLGDLAEFEQWEQSSSSLPFEYIRDLRPFMATGRKATLKAAAVEILKGSFQYKTGKYSLELKLEDGSEALQATMSDEAVAEMIGVPCTEFKANLLKGLEGINENKRLMRQLELALFNLEGLVDITLEVPSCVMAV